MMTVSLFIRAVGGTRRPGQFLRLMAGLALLCALAMHGPTAAQADPYTVTDIEVDVTAKDPQAAKLKAISEAQVKAFHKMLERLTTKERAASFKSLDAARIGRMMSSMAVQKEQTGPNRYIATLTISFLPNRVRELLDRQGVAFTEVQAPPTTVLPVWIGKEGPVLWGGANPWQEAWRRLDLRNAVAPVILPLGDSADAAAVSADQAIMNDPGAFNSVAVRYKTETVLTAVAEMVAMNEIAVSAEGLSSGGPVSFKKNYEVVNGDIAGTLATAAAEVLGAIQAQWKSVASQRIETKAPTQSIRMGVSFGSLAEWTNIRGRLLSTPGIRNVDVESLSGNGAVTRLEFQQSIPQLQDHLARSGFMLTQAGDMWVLRTR
jgi:hypothetical protein